jgi:DNA-binding LacI/PurR family transcriptional regulator
MVTSKDVAARAGVSQSTVSYVMSGKRSISEKTRRRVEEAIEALTYHPNAGARALASRRTSVIALVVRFWETTDMAGVLPFIETITALARERDYDTVLVTTDEGPAGLSRLAGRAICDAIVLMDIRSRDERLEVAESLDVPVVLVGVPEEPTALDTVDYDAGLAGRLAVDELAETGHHQIVVVGEPPEVEVIDYRFIHDFEHAAEARAAERGLRFALVRPDRPGWRGIADVADLLLQHRTDRLGLIARTPQAIGWLLQLLLQRGIVPGADVSIVGLCTDAVAMSFSVEVTNVSPEPREVSTIAVETVFRRLDGDAAPAAPVLVRPVLTRRATTTLFAG